MTMFTFAKYQRTVGLLLDDGEDVIDEDGGVAFARACFPALEVEAVWLLYTGPGWFVTTELPQMHLPSEADARDKCLIVRADRVDTYDLVDRFNRCTQLIKIMGCSSCDMRGAECIRTGEFPETPPPKDVPTSGWDKRTVAGYEFVDPAHTRDRPFSDRVRPAHQHDFGEIEKNRKDNQLRSQAAASTRKRNNEKCSQCILGMKKKSGNFTPGCERRSSYCEGPYADEETQVRALLAKWDPAVNRFIAEGNFTREQFWQIAREAGASGIFERRQFVLSGWVPKDGFGKRFSLEIFREKTRTYSVESPAKNYGELREMFKNLPRTMPGKGTPSSLLRALWYLSLESNNVPVRNGWGRTRRDIAYRRIDNSKVSIRTAAERYLSWGEKELYSLFGAYTYFEVTPDVTVQTKGTPQEAPQEPTQAPSEPSEPPAEQEELLAS